MIHQIPRSFRSQRLEPNDITMMEEIKKALSYAMQVKICATGDYMMAEIQETQLEVKLQVIFNTIKKYGR